jgi:hypothetical protein
MGLNDIVASRGKQGIEYERKGVQARKEYSIAGDLYIQKPKNCDAIYISPTLRHLGPPDSISPTCGTEISHRDPSTFGAR